MKRHKKRTVLVYAFLMTLSIAACGRTKEDEIDSNSQKSDIQTSQGTDSQINEDKTINKENSPANQQQNDMQTNENTDSETKKDETIKKDTSSANQQQSNMQTNENTDSETKKDETTKKDTSSANQQQNNAQTSQQENSVSPVKNDSEMTSEELLDLFINGSISAVDSTDLTSSFYITDLNKDAEEWNSYCVGEKVDLDNDGENELVINGPYGGIYLDARNNKVYEFAEAGGTALTLSYVYYNGTVWIMYSNKSSAGFEFYHMEKFEGADNLVAEMSFGEEFDINNSEDELKYTLNGEEISSDEYIALCNKIFAAEVTSGTENNKDETDQTQINKDNVLKHLIGQYEYLSDYGTGKLIIQRTLYGYDISDYESESSYRFLADSSNIETIENNRILIKYPEQVLSDDTVIFCYYILEYSTNEINVYYKKSELEEEQFLYHAVKNKEEQGQIVSDQVDSQIPTEGLEDTRNSLYEAFLKNETSVPNPYVEGMNLTVMDDKTYESEFEDAQKKYAYVDVNGDENPELIFKISSYPSELMYILGIYNNELICFDVFETHTKNIAFGVYDYGFVWKMQNYDGFEMTFYTYTADGQPVRARRFTEEDDSSLAAHEGEEPEWIDWQ